MVSKKQIVGPYSSYHRVIHYIFFISAVERNNKSYFFIFFLFQYQLKSTKCPILCNFATPPDRQETVNVVSLSSSLKLLILFLITISGY